MVDNKLKGTEIIILDGSFDDRGRCQRISINGIGISIQPRCYGYLLALARELKNGDGWLHRKDFPGVEWERQHAIIYRLRNQTKLDIMNDHKGSYKLNCKQIIILEENPS